MKKSTYLFALALGVSTLTFAQNVGINTDGSNPDSDAILHINNHSGSSADSSIIRIENEQNGANDVTGVELYNSGTGATAKWDVYIPASGSTDLRINNNGSDHVTIQNDGDVGIGTTSPVSTLDVNGSVGYAVTTITSATTLDNTHNVVLCNTGAYTVTLPAAASNTGRIYYIKNIDTDGDDITIDGNGAETIDGSATYVLDTYLRNIKIISDGSNWHVISNGNNGSLTTLTCASSTDYGTLTIDVVASGVSSTIPYTGGNGGTHSGQTVTSTGVTGLTATLTAGSFASGSDSLTYTITGTPASDGTASFAIDIGGQTCTLTRTVNASFTCGDDVTWTYNGGSVTYGTVSSSGECWLDRNLGGSQVATSSTDHLAYGDLFQWGRGDDGHQEITWTNSTTGSGANSTTATNATNDTPGDALFITEGTTPFDWRVAQNDNLWQGVSGTNNPCPSGWRLPTETEWTAERTSWSTDDAAGAYGSALKLTLTGYRDRSTGNIGSAGTGAGYWSSTINGTNSRVLAWNHVPIDWYNDARAYAEPVRCLMD
jgi:uncharacterized protein (TIGR02145 family)